jgi:hypothetical protein
VDTTSVALTGRSRFTDPRFFEEVSDLTGIEYRVLSSAFAGERKDLALDVVKTVVAENLDAGPERWAERLLERAKGEGFGDYRPGYWDGYELTYEHNDHLRSIGRF